MDAREPVVVPITVSVVSAKLTASARTETDSAKVSASTVAQ
jgi:hypothetical protein